MWLRDGDFNIKLFHGKDYQRRRTNSTKRLKDKDGIWRRGEDNIERIFLDCFSDLFASYGPSDIPQVCSVV